MEDLPFSQSITPRPVWERRHRRLQGHGLPPPTEAEKHDAIRVLADQTNETEAPSMWIEATMILDEAGV
jgi:hypothetical protein